MKLNEIALASQRCQTVWNLINLCTSVQYGGNWRNSSPIDTTRHTRRASELVRGASGTFEMARQLQLTRATLLPTAVECRRTLLQFVCLSLSLSVCLLLAIPLFVAPKLSDPRPRSVAQVCPASVLSILSPLLYSSARILHYVAWRCVRRLEPTVATIRVHSIDWLFRAKEHTVSLPASLQSHRTGCRQTDAVRRGPSLLFAVHVCKLDGTVRNPQLAICNTNTN